MIIWFVDSGVLHHMVLDQDLLHNFVPFDTKPCINTAKAGQYSYATGYGDVHQLLQTSAGECETILCGVWCDLGLSSKLFSVWAHLESAWGNCRGLEFTVSVLCTLGFTLPLVDDPTSGSFSFSGVVVIASPFPSLVAPAVAPPACSRKSTSMAPLDVWHHHLGHPHYDTLSQLKSHVHNFVVTGSFKLDTSLGLGCGCDTRVCCNLHCHPRTDTTAHTMTATGQRVHVDGASGFPCVSLVHTFVGIYLFVDDYSDTCVAISYHHKSGFIVCFKEYCPRWYGDNVVVCALKMHMKFDCASKLPQGTFCKFADDNAIAFHHSAPHEPRETSAVEHHVGVIQAMACAVSYDAGFWPLMCFFTVEAVCLQHSLCLGPHGVAPHQLDYGLPPSLQWLFLHCGVSGLLLQLHFWQLHHAF